VGQLLKLLDDLGLAENTIVMYSTDNGGEVMSWPDGAPTPSVRESHNWEGGWRVPDRPPRPGTIKPASVFNGHRLHEDLLPTCWPPQATRTQGRRPQGTKKIGNTTYMRNSDGLQPSFRVGGKTKEDTGLRK